MSVAVLQLISPNGLDNDLPPFHGNSQVDPFLLLPSLINRDFALHHDYCLASACVCQLRIGDLPLLDTAHPTTNFP
jgi:hypothetical protein